VRTQYQPTLSSRLPRPGAHSVSHQSPPHCLQDPCTMESTPPTATGMPAQEAPITDAPASQQADGGALGASAPGVAGAALHLAASSPSDASRHGTGMAPAPTPQLPVDVAPLSPFEQVASLDRQGGAGNNDAVAEEDHAASSAAIGRTRSPSKPAIRSSGRAIEINGSSLANVGSRVSWHDHLVSVREFEPSEAEVSEPDWDERRSDGCCSMQ
jgi:hypothetical protein